MAFDRHLRRCIRLLAHSNVINTGMNHGGTNHGPEGRHASPLRRLLQSLSKAPWPARSVIGHRPVADPPVASFYATSPDWDGPHHLFCYHRHYAPLISACFIYPLSLSLHCNPPASCATAVTQNTSAEPVESSSGRSLETIRAFIDDLSISRLFSAVLIMQINH